ncbi:MAG: hypothetical protein DME37_03440 [Verrucomicrobia bacterium]|nr:MAG: hypothetical protein DME37_03440 [Verrucomicrobiota bacterium]
MDAHEKPLKRLLLRVLLNGTGLKAGVNEKGVGGRSPRGCGARLGLAFRITTAMKHLLHSGAAILLASFISGCATHVTMIGPARPPISPAAVRIYENPPRHYQQIAIINSSAGTTWLFPDRGSLDEAIADLRREAAALGANGVLLQAVYDRPVGGLSVGVGGFGYGRHNFYGGGGSVGGPLINRRVQAIAIYVHR